MYMGLYLGSYCGPYMSLQGYLVYKETYTKETERI